MWELGMDLRSNSKSMFGSAQLLSKSGVNFTHLPSRPYCLLLFCITELALGAPNSSQSEFMVCESMRKLSLTPGSEAFSINQHALGLLCPLQGSGKEWVPSSSSALFDWGLLAGYRITSGPVGWAVCNKGSVSLQGKMKRGENLRAQMADLEKGPWADI